MTFQPSSAYWRANSRPSPRPAPVIRTLRIGSSASWCGRRIAWSIAAASGRVAELDDQRAGGVLEQAALRGGHLLAPYIKAAGVGRAHQVGMNARALLARDHRPLRIPTPLQALQAGGALGAVVEHARIPVQRQILAQALELALGASHQVFEADFDVVGHRAPALPAGLHVFAPALSQHAQVLAWGEESLAP